MHDDICEALRWLPGEISIETDRAGAVVTTPQRVFMRCTKNRWTCTPSRGFHLVINGGTASLSCRRYQVSTMACFYVTSVPGQTRRSRWRCCKATDGAAAPSSTVSR